MQLAALLLLVAVEFGCSTKSVGLTPIRPTHDDKVDSNSVVYTYRIVEDDSLEAYVFRPSSSTDGRPANAILLFHGGGWVAGSPEWTFGAAERFAGYGLVAIAIEYRLSGPNVTPIDALDDVCHAFSWARQYAKDLGIAEKIVGYGVSAGGQLAAATGTIGCGGISADPDALLLWSPAIDVTRDGWFSKLLDGRAEPIDYSPVDHVNASSPPTCIVQGAEDSLTPLSNAQRFCEELTNAGVVCELNVYSGVGHL
ncbi:MAG TPA: alpha/beta hydrolase, partial [Candidatus Krumholzibacteria bacterium]|nr:alpha/beta hydrolase [Candidatus Krumholzibacteria bacterium]